MSKTETQDSKEQTYTGTTARDAFKAGETMTDDGECIYRFVDGRFERWREHLQGWSIAFINMDEAMRRTWKLKNP